MEASAAKMEDFAAFVRGFKSRLCCVTSAPVRAAILYYQRTVGEFSPEDFTFTLGCIEHSATVPSPPAAFTIIIPTPRVDLSGVDREPQSQGPCFFKGVVLLPSQLVLVVVPAILPPNAVRSRGRRSIKTPAVPATAAGGHPRLVSPTAIDR